MEEKTLAELRPLPTAVCVNIYESLEQMVRTMLDHPESPNISVVNEASTLLGVINIKSLFRTIFSHHIDPYTMVRHLIKLASAEIAGDIMVTDPVVALTTETVDDAARKMVAHDLGELPVVAQRRQVLGSISIRMILDLWLQAKPMGNRTEVQKK